MTSPEKAARPHLQTLLARPRPPHGRGGTQLVPRVLPRQSGAPRIFRPEPEWDGDWDTDMGPLDQAVWAADLAAWQSECEQSRLAAAPHDLDDTGLRRWRTRVPALDLRPHDRGVRPSNGHADLVREMVDGAAGW